MTKKNLPVTPVSSEARRRLLAKIHIRAKELFGKKDEGVYQTFLYNVCEKTSCKDMTMQELMRVDTAMYERIVALAFPHLKTDITHSQLAHLARLCERMGWEDGLNDARLLGFINRTLGVRFLRSDVMTNRQASAVITGLRKWADSIDPTKEYHPCPESSSVEERFNK